MLRGKMIYHDVGQGSDEWFALRIGKITSSHFAEIMVQSKGGIWGVGAIKYAQRVALERTTGKRVDDEFQSDWMKQGNENEPIARSKYAIKTKQIIIENGGLFVNGEWATSPDGFVENLGQEIKCVKYNTHFDTMKRGNPEPKYKWQMQGQILIAGFDSVDFIEYCEKFPPETELIIHNIKKDPAMQEQLEARLLSFSSLIKEYEKLIGVKNAK